MAKIQTPESAATPDTEKTAGTEKTADVPVTMTENVTSEQPLPMTERRAAIPEKVSHVDERTRRSPLAEVMLTPYTIAHDVVDTIRQPEGMTLALGLGAAAVLGAIEWPVAVAVGLGAAVARGMRR